ncbi:MAG: glycerol kinase, partial [Flavobacteriales bacterium]|nr:glycerol kinase [Flavobacteriales bacterium]
QSALFGQLCFEKGNIKNTYGTGCFMLMNIGENFKLSENGLLTTIGWKYKDNVCYALEGSVFIAGAAIQWLRDGLRLLDHSSDSEYFAERANSNEVVVVPAFSGLGAPYWDMDAKGAIFGLTRDTGKAEIIRATLQSLAFQSMDLMNAMEQDAGAAMSELYVDGGATANNWLMQFQSNINNIQVNRPTNLESTAMGVAYMAGLELGWWNKEELTKLKEMDRVFEPSMDHDVREELIAKWIKAVQRTMNWDE